MKFSKAYAAALACLCFLAGCSSQNSSESSITETTAETTTAAQTTAVTTTPPAQTTATTTTTEPPKPVPTPTAPLCETVGDQLEIDTKPLELLSTVLEKDRYTIDLLLTYEADGESYQMPMISVKDGDNAYAEMNIAGLLGVKIVRIQGKNYQLDNTHKLCYQEDMYTTADEVAMVSDTEDYISKVSDISAVTQAFAVSLEDADYVRYTFPNNTYLYTADGTPKYIAVYDEDSEKIMRIDVNELSENADETYFILPEDFTLVSKEEYEKQVLGA